MKTQKYGTLFIRYQCSGKKLLIKDHEAFMHSSREEMFLMTTVLLSWIRRARLSAPDTFGTDSLVKEGKPFHSLTNRGGP
jgi:hypothetical protein